MVLGFDTVEVAAVEGEGQQHDVARHRAGDGDADQERTIAAAFDGGGFCPPEGVGRVADGIEESGDPGEVGGVRVPHQRRLRPTDVEPALGDAGNHHRRSFHQPHAGRAVDSLEVELDRGQAVGMPTRVELLKGGIVEVLVAGAGGEGGATGLVDALPYPVVLVEARPANDLVRHPTARATELRLGVLVHQPCRNGQAAVVTDRRRGGHMVVVVAQYRGSGISVMQ